MPRTAVALSADAGRQVLSIARQHIGQKYVLGVTVPKNNPNWKGPWDCAEFASWAVFQVSTRLYGCAANATNPATAEAYTGYWERDANAVGRRVTIEEAAGTAGAFVLRTARPGSMGHIVISDGAGGTVEAMSSKTGVVASTLAQRRWDMGILVAGIHYAPGTDVVVPQPSGIIYRLTSPMMTGPKVLEIQQKLQKAGFDPGAIDGKFGSLTHAAVVAFQMARGLVADGEVGPVTAAALRLKP
jgi:murein L,D-transpeptidase YcbB/YkuD